MKCFAVNLILGLALAACTSAPEPARAEWVPCGGDGFYEAANSYARCIRHIAILAEARPGENR